MATPARATALVAAADPQRSRVVSQDAELSHEPDINVLCKTPSLGAALRDLGQLSLCWESVAKSRTGIALVF